MLDIRRMTAEDFEAVAAFAEEGLQPHRYPLVYSRAKLRGVVEHFMSSTTDYHRIAVENGRVVGVIAAAMGNMPWFERGEMQIMAFYATRSGVGRTLLRGLVRFMDESPFVRRIGWAQNPDASKATNRLARMCAGARRVDEVTLQVIYKD